MPKIWNMSFLKRHDLSGFPDNSFLFSDGMSDFCDIVFQKWSSQSEISDMSLLVCNILPQNWGKTFRSRNFMPQIRGIFMHGWQNLPPIPGHVFPRSDFYAPNLRHIYAWVAKSSPKSGARFSEVGILCPQSGACLCMGGKIFPQFWGTFFRGRNVLPQI